MVLSNWINYLFFLMLLGWIPLGFGQTVQIYVPESAQPRHPLAIDRDESRALMQMIAPTLLTASPTGEWTCQLCDADKDGEIADVEIKKKNKRSYVQSTWTLQKNIFWGDGTAVSNQDVLLAWDIIRTTKHPLFRDLLAAVSEIRADGKNHHIFHVEHRQPFFRADALAKLPLLPSHVESSIWKQHEANFSAYLAASKYTVETYQPGLYCGFYLPQKSATGVRLSLNPRGPAPATKIANTSLARLPSDSNPRTLLNAGSTLLLEGDFEQAFATISDLKKAGSNNGAHITSQTSNWLEYISFNIRNPLLADARMRQALAASLDRSELATLMHLPDAAIAKGLFAEFDFRFAGLEKALSFDPIFAAKTLEEIGWKLQAKDQRRWRADRKLTVQLIYDSSSAYRRKLGGWIQKSWAAVGIETELKGYENSRSFAEALKKIDYTGAALFAWHLDNAMPPTPAFSSKEIPTIDNDYRGKNFSAWRNSSVDLILESLETTSEKKVITKLYSNLAAQFSRDLPGLPLFFHPKMIISPKPLGQMPLFNGEASASLALMRN